MLFKASQIDNTRQLNLFAKKTGIAIKRLQYYNDTHKMPSGADLEIILKETGISEIQLMLMTGCLNQELKSLISKNADQISKILSSGKKGKKLPKDMEPVFNTELGQLYQCDCLDLLRGIENDSLLT